MSEDFSPVAVSRRVLAPTWRNALGRYMPQAYGYKSRWEFRRRRQQEYLEDVGGDPSPTQVRLIAHAIAVEWSALDTEHTALSLVGNDKIEAMRIASEYRRQLNLALWHFQKTLPKAKQGALGEEKGSASLPDMIAESLAGKAK